MPLLEDREGSYSIGVLLALVAFVAFVALVADVMHVADLIFSYKEIKALVGCLSLR